MSDLIPRDDEPRFGQRQTPAPAWGLWNVYQGSSKVVIRCGFGHVANLSLPEHEGHAIAADGEVTPSLVCPSAGCTWHVWGRLVGWDPATKRI